MSKAAATPDPGPITAYKGFEPDLTCRGYQFVEGQTHEHDGPLEVCRSGFHAVLAPIDVLSHYPPAGSVYRVVQLQEVTPQSGRDSKVAARKLTVGASIGIPGLVKAQIEYVTSRATTEEGGHATGDRGAASATGYSGAASATGYRGAASATGDRGAASATGDRGAASATGDRGAASATGYRGAASATGDSGAASATGYRGAASATGDESIALAAGRAGRARGATGCWIVLTERDENWHILDVRAFLVDDEEIKAGVFYQLVAGKPVKAVDQSAVPA